MYICTCLLCVYVTSPILVLMRAYIHVGVCLLRVLFSIISTLVYTMYMYHLYPLLLSCTPILTFQAGANHVTVFYFQPCNNVYSI